MGRYRRLVNGLRELHCPFTHNNQGIPCTRLRGERHVLAVRD